MFWTANGLLEGKSVAEVRRKVELVCRLLSDGMKRDLIRNKGVHPFIPEIGIRLPSDPDLELFVGPDTAPITRYADCRPRVEHFLELQEQCE